MDSSATVVWSDGGRSKVEAMTSPFTERCMSVTSSGRSSTRTTMRWHSGLFVVIALAIALGALLAGAGEGDLVDERPVRVDIGEVPAGQLGELGQRADDDQARRVLVVAPDRQRRAPVAVAGERPVDVVAQPVAVAAPLHGFRVPVRALVLAQQRVLDRAGADVPGRLR